MAVDPSWAVAFCSKHGIAAWLALGAVVLAITGGEVLYADMGHFGRGPIRIGWLSLVLPALLLYPMIILATMAAVIVSQALISGTFSVVRGAIPDACSRTTVPAGTAYAAR